MKNSKEYQKEYMRLYRQRNKYSDGYDEVRTSERVYIDMLKKNPVAYKRFLALKSFY